MTVFVLSQGLVTCEDPPVPVHGDHPVGVFATELEALETIEKHDDGLRRAWTITTLPMGQFGGGGVHGFHQETWKWRLEDIRAQTGRKIIVNYIWSGMTASEMLTHLVAGAEEALRRTGKMPGGAVIQKAVYEAVEERKIARKEGLVSVRQYLEVNCAQIIGAERFRLTAAE